MISRARLKRLEQQLAPVEDERLERLIAAVVEGREPDTKVSAARRRANRNSLESLIERSLELECPVSLCSGRDNPPALNENPDSSPHAAPPPSYRAIPVVEPPVPPSPIPPPPTLRPPVIPVATVWPVAEPPVEPPVAEPVEVEPINIGEKILAHQRAWLERRFERPGHRSNWDPFAR